MALQRSRPAAARRKMYSHKHATALHLAAAHDTYMKEDVLFVYAKGRTCWGVKQAPKAIGYPEELSAGSPGAATFNVDFWPERRLSRCHVVGQR